MQCAIYGFGLLKRRQMATMTNDLKPGITNQAMRPLGYGDWKYPIIFGVQDQGRNGDLGQPIDVVRPKAAPADFATLQLSECNTCAALADKAHQFVNQHRRD